MLKKPSEQIYGARAPDIEFVRPIRGAIGDSPLVARFSLVLRVRMMRPPGLPEAKQLAAPWGKQALGEVA